MARSEIQPPFNPGDFPDAAKAAEWNERAASLVSHGLVLGLLASLTIGVIQFTQRLLPSWEGGYLLWLAVVIAIESMVTTRAVRRINWFEADRFFLRGTEWVVIVVSLRGFIYFLQGIGQLRADIARWGFEIFNYFNNLEYLAVLIFIFIIWSLASAFARDLAEQEGDRLIVDQDTLRFALQDREISRHRMVNRVFSLGILLVVLSALVRADLGILWGGRPRFAGGGINLLFYFMLGLVLFSLSQYATLRAFWTWDRIPIDQHLSRNWARYSISFLLAVVAVVSILPTRFSLGFLASMQYLLFSILNFLSTLVMVIWSFFLFLIYLLARSLGRGDSGFLPPERVLPEFTPPVTPPPGASDPALAWVDGLRIFLFWFVFLAVVFYSFDYFFRHYQGRLGWVRQVSWVQALGRIWTWLRDRFWIWNKNVALAVRDGVNKIREGRIPHPKWDRSRLKVFNPLRLTARQQVIFYYLAMVKKGAVQGIPRGPGQTPREYENNLKNMVPEAAEEVAELTETFSAARYSNHGIGRDRAQKARFLWRVIQKAFRLKED